jgi:hypothetical protein
LATATASPHFAHHRQVDHVVAHIGNLVQRHAFLGHDLAHRLHLEGLPW